MNVYRPTNNMNGTVSVHFRGYNLFLYGIDGISKYRAGPTRHEKLKTCVLLEVIIVR